MYETQIKALTDYYEKMFLKNGHLADPVCDNNFFQIRSRIYQEMDTFYDENPDLSPVLYKSRLHTLIAKYCEPVIFAENPFFFEIGMHEADSWGLSSINPAEWFRNKMKEKIFSENPNLKDVEQKFAPVLDLKDLGLCEAPNSFDIDHHTLGYTSLFSTGINGLIEKAYAQMNSFEAGTESWYFCQAVIESCQAVLTIAGKFAESAKKRYERCDNEQERHYLKMIAETAGHIPANPPETFYEGLAFLLFMREVSASLESIGISQLGHVDRLLGTLYENDLRTGQITEEKARTLIGIWMLYTDIKFDLKHNSWPETSTCIQLGGCDSEGNPVYNAVTRMFIEEHHRLNLVNPKLNCRYMDSSPDEYLEIAGAAMLAGHNNFVMINDDIIISGLISNGVEKKDARLYVSGGCQETMIEGCGHTEGVAFYASVTRVLDLFLQGDGREFVKPVGRAETFEDFYDSFMDALCDFFYKMIEWRNYRQTFYKWTTICPLFSATQAGCIEQGKDYSHGGAKYNFSTISLIGFATVVDSLFAVKSLVYEEKKLSLEQFINILKENWQGNDVLRKTAISLPKYGHNHPEADAFANRFLKDFTGALCERKNERGGTYIPSLFVYYHYETFSHCLRAMPDGRKDYELISSGAAPGQLKEIKDVTMPVKSAYNIDFTMCRGGSAVLDVKLPLSNHLNPTLFAAFIRACGQYHCPTIQPNIVSPEELLDAKVHPENHKNLIVRICGLSAYFVALTPEVQDEIIGRNLYSV